MLSVFRRLFHELGNGRAVANAGIERDEQALMYARLDRLERHFARTASAASVDVSSAA